ncbi:MAG: GTPase domain-containing protein, partial [Lachnospiraceae bacterium]|nr:GTPase domain-containing protein [Lachnospiraceae bacterium]
MEKIRQALQEIAEINTAYGLSNEKIQKTLDEMETAKVCTPIIGRFSSGKSALSNALLGYKGGLLKEAITPETAVPAEIIYEEGEDNGVIYWNDGREEQIGIEDYQGRELEAEKVRAVRLRLYNGVLEKFPDVMLVDMPGFESGCEIHNRAIDGYLPQSLAYLITFAADDMIVRESIGSILGELCLHQMPLCVVITKCDKQGEDFEKSLEHLKQSLKRYIGNQPVTYCQTSSRNGEIEELKRFLAG